MRRVRSSRSTRRGLTLIELVVSLAISSFLVAAAVTLTGDHVRLLGLTTERVDMYQESRRAMDMIALDVRQAGVGLAYRPSGWFDGLSRGDFVTDGGAVFNSNNRMIKLDGGTFPTDDLGIRLANGDFRTIAAFDASTGQICSGGNFKAGDIVAFSSREGLYSMTAKIGSLSPSPCSEGSCIAGCTAFSWSPVASFGSDPAAWTASYDEGQVAGAFQHLVWYVGADAEGRGELRRAIVDADHPCTSLTADCGGTVARDVETLQTQLWSWDATTSKWVNISADPEIMNRDRLRVDVEIVMRGRNDYDLGLQAPVALALESSVCVPDCTKQDHVARWAIRSSVEIRNSGRLELR